jgi:hypothetical protein
MKNLLLSLICVLVATVVSAQNVGIGTTDFTPETDAILELRSTTTGFLVPRMTDAQMTAISGPTEGLLVYQTNATKGFQYYNGSAWTAFGGGGADNLGNHTADQNIRLSDFWLSNDGGDEGIRVTNDGKVGIGLSNPAKELDVNGHMRLAGLAGSGNRMMVVDNGGNVSAQALPAAPLWSTNGVDVFRTSGKVGMGTSSPLTNLDLYGNGTSGFILGGTTAVPNPAEGPEIGFGRGGFGNPGATIQMIDYDSYSAGLAFIVRRGVANSAGGVFADNFPSDAIQALTIINSGKVGIGTSNPQAILDVNGNARIADLAGSGTRMVVADAQGDLSTQAIPSGGGGAAYGVNGTGSVSTSSGSYSNISGMVINLTAGTYILQFNSVMEADNASAMIEFGFSVNGAVVAASERDVEPDNGEPKSITITCVVTVSSTSNVYAQFRKSTGSGSVYVGNRCFTAIKIS